MYYLEPLADEERENILESINQLECFPGSIRLFNELHQICFDLVDTRGKRIWDVQPSRSYKPEEDREDGMSFFYMQHPFGKDTLNIIYTFENQRKELFLGREKGYQTRKKEDKLDFVSSILRGDLETFIGRRTYEAYELFQFLIEGKNRALVLEHEY